MSSEELPGWLTTDLIKAALQDYTGSQEAVVQKWEAESAVSKGNNYSGIILRCHVEYRVSKEQEKVENVSFIIKRMRESCFDEFVKPLGISKKEFQILRVVMTEIKGLFGDYLGPKAYLLWDEEVLLLEDLKSDGYEMADRRKQLDFDHCVCALTTLAKFHAGSVRIQETNPELFHSVSREVIFAEELTFWEDFAKSTFEAAVKEVKSWPECKEYSDSIDEKCANLNSNLKEIVKPKPGAFNVLNHGDFWTTNMMFKYENGKPVNAKLFDFQVSRCTTPAIDIHHLFTTSAQSDATARFDELIDVYLDVLNKHLEISKSTKRLHRSELEKSLEECLPYAFNVCVTGLAIVLADNDKIVDVGEFTMEDLSSEEDSIFSDNFKSSLFRKVCIEKLKGFERIGFISKHKNQEETPQETQNHPSSLTEDSVSEEDKILHDINIQDMKM